jgi:transcriptional regulator GlxA family with amidase domain
MRSMKPRGRRTRVEARRVLVVAFPGVQVLDVTGPIEVFSRASRWLLDEGRRKTPAYEASIVASAEGIVRTSSGIGLAVDQRWRDVSGPIDTLLVAGGIGTEAALGDRPLLRWLARTAPRARRFGSVCSGTFLLAEAGLLDGRRVVTHWRVCPRLAESYPQLTVDPDPIFIRDGRLWTSAGVTAGMDLALALVEEDHGREAALAVARELVLFLRRPGGQSQFSAQLAAQAAEREPLRDLQGWIADHLEADLSVPALAARAAMSPRNFARVFRREIGVTPARYVEALRVEAARRRLEESSNGVDTVASGAGFGSAETMRRAFARRLRVAPSAYRSRFEASAAR